jgi:predicted RNA binding protein YcfA (HicA-like mRNA interferase family)
MSRLPAVTAREIVRVARRLGYPVREGAKHTIIHDGRQVITTVPRSSGSLKRGLVAGIISDLGLSAGEFRRLL